MFQRGPRTGPGVDGIAMRRRKAEHILMPVTKLQWNTVTIKAIFGSDMQRNVAMRVLRGPLDEWKTYTQGRHTRNRISITYGRAPPVKNSDTIS